MFRCLFPRLVTASLPLLFLLPLHSSTVDVEGLHGKHVCRHQQRYLVNVTRIVPAYVKVRTYTWCMAVPPRCSKYQIQVKNETEVVEEERVRSVEQCCEGYREEPATKTCHSVCPQDCNGRGDCAPEGCLCHPGYNGTLCDQVCSTNSWGQNCRFSCLCERGACDPKSGFCACPSGWKGERCEERCSGGYYGNGCAEVCKCGGPNRSCDHITGACGNNNSKQFANNKTESPILSIDSTAGPNNNNHTGVTEIPIGNATQTTSGEFESTTFDWVPIGPFTIPSTKTSPTLTKYYSFDFAPSTSTSTESSSKSVANQIKNISINLPTTPLPDYITATATTTDTKTRTRNVTSPVRNLPTEEEAEAVARPAQEKEPEEVTTVRQLLATTPNEITAITMRNFSEIQFDGRDTKHRNQQRPEVELKRTVAPNNVATGSETVSHGVRPSNNARDVIQTSSITEHKRYTMKAKVIPNEVTLAGPSGQEEDSVLSWYNSNAGNGDDNVANRIGQSSIIEREEGHAANHAAFDRRLLSSIAITVGVTVLLVVLAIAIIIVSEKHKGRRNDKTPGVKSPRATTSVSVITHSTFHAPLPEINYPLFENPVFTTPLEGTQEFEKPTFSAHVICSMDIYRDNATNGQIESLYDHPPPRGTFRVTPVPDTDDNPPEPLYDEIPCWKVPVMPESPKLTTFQHPNYMNTFKS